MSVYKELTDRPLDVLIAYWFGEPIGGPEYADSFFEEVAYEIARHGEDGARFLVEQLTANGQDRIHCLIGGLSISECPEDRRKDLIRPFLTSESPRERSEAIGAFRYFRDPAVRAQIEPQLQDKDDHVRAGALGYMGKVFPLESLDFLEISLDDPAWNVRKMAIDELDELEDIELSNAFMDRIWPFLDDPHRHVRWSANWYLMTRIWWEEDVDDIRERIALESDSRRVASLVRFAGDQGQHDIVLDFLINPHPTVRLAAIDELDNWDGPILAALERDPDFIKKCANDPDQRVQEMVPELEERLRFEMSREFGE
jgi:hypothetical protein